MLDPNYLVSDDIMDEEDNEVEISRSEDEEEELEEGKDEEEELEEVKNGTAAGTMFKHEK